MQDFLLGRGGGGLFGKAIGGSVGTQLCKKNPLNNARNRYGGARFSSCVGHST